MAGNPSAGSRGNTVDSRTIDDYKRKHSARSRRKRGRPKGALDVERGAGDRPKGGRRMLERRSRESEATRETRSEGSRCAGHYPRPRSGRGYPAQRPRARSNGVRPRTARAVNGVNRERARSGRSCVGTILLPCFSSEQARCGLSRTDRLRTITSARSPVPGHRSETERHRHARLGGASDDAQKGGV